MAPQEIRNQRSIAVKEALFQATKLRIALSLQRIIESHDAVHRLFQLVKQIQRRLEFHRLMATKRKRRPKQFQLTRIEGPLLAEPQKVTIPEMIPEPIPVYSCKSGLDFFAVE